jgi:hypothetical protein
LIVQQRLKSSEQILFTWNSMKRWCLNCIWLNPRCLVSTRHLTFLAHF